MKKTLVPKKGREFSPAVPPKLTTIAAQLVSLTRKTAPATVLFTDTGSKASSSSSYRLAPTARSLKSSDPTTAPFQRLRYLIHFIVVYPNLFQNTTIHSELFTYSICNSHSVRRHLISMMHQSVYMRMKSHNAFQLNLCINTAFTHTNGTLYLLILTYTHYATHTYTSIFKRLHPLTTRITPLI